MPSENWDHCESCSAQNFLSVGKCINCGADLGPQREKHERQRQERERVVAKRQTDYDAGAPERPQKRLAREQLETKQKEERDVANNEREERAHQRMQASEKLYQEKIRTTRDIVLVALVLLLLLIGGGMWGCPQYRVYNQSMTGQANLRQQEFEKLIRIEDARAQMESAGLFAQAEVERARGVAEANQIIGESLQNNEAYLRYLWIQGLHDSDKDNVIYVPTEANLPILEASRLQQLGQ